MSSTFESLPDEILMAIFQYFGDVCTLFQVFLGLNQRLNNILIDKRLHLFTDLLCTNFRDDYYNSEIFQQASQQLLPLKTPIPEKHLSEILQPLISYHIQQKYIQLENDFQLSLVNFQSIREQLSDDEIVTIDDKLKAQFDNLRNDPINPECIKQIKFLVLRQGARLECDDNESTRYNLSKAINERLLQHINSTTSDTFKSINSFVELFKTLIISNPSLLKNQDYVGNGGCRLHYFVIHIIYRLRHFYHSISSSPINMNYYRATTDLCLFTIQAWKYVSDNVFYIEDNMFDILEMMSKISEDIFIQTAQWEIMKIVVDDFFIQSNGAWDNLFKDRLKQLFKQLIGNHRLDVIKYIYFYFRFEDFFDDPKYIRECINLMTPNQLERRFFCGLINDQSLDLLFPKNNLLFILLEKKERKLIEKLLKLSPYLIHEIDEDGNDPLLYICLKVSGCRHRIIEYLIKMGSDLERKNFQDQNFMDALQLQRNKKLLETLYEHEII